MNEAPTYYIGLMSGTSIDSIDAAIVDFASSKFNIVATHSIDISPELKNHILALALPGDDEIARMRILDQALAGYFAQAAIDVCNKSGIARSEIKAIGSHGQTIRHYPKTEKKAGFSLQIADPNIIAERTGITTIADFRRRDIAAGGHGAPLAPAFHQAAFSHEHESRIILNLGGIANVTYLPTSGDTVGFDSGPANILMDSWCQTHLHQAYDQHGQWARSGNINRDLLTHLLEEPYFSEQPPKSTGRERFNLSWLESGLNHLEKPINPSDVQATLLALTTTSIAQAVDQIDPDKESCVYACGGGAHNKALKETLQEAILPRTLKTTEALELHPNWVECAAFAWLAKQTLEHQTSNLIQVTGAKKPVILGGIYWGS